MGIELLSRPGTITLFVLASTIIIQWCEVHFGYTWVCELFPQSDGILAAVAAELVSLLWYVLPATAFVALLHGNERVWDELGLRHHIGPGMGYALAFTVPMLLWDVWIGNLVIGSEVPLLVLAQFRAAFREEVFHRAFLFG